MCRRLVGECDATVQPDDSRQRAHERYRQPVSRGWGVRVGVVSVRVRSLFRFGGAAIGGLALVAGSLAAGLFVASRISEGGEASDQIVAAPEDPGVVHVHGLGVNPSDGTLFAATHSGLFRIDSKGRAQRVADRFQDTMAFQVVGPNRFLASGHPDPREPALHAVGKPPLLGLVESVDAGSKWQPLSLLGEADFHAISARGDTILAYDSTGATVLASADGGRTWNPRSPIELRDLAVDPVNPEHVVAVDGAGNLVESRDGARSWTPFASRLESPVAVLAWAADALWAGSENGTLARWDSAAGAWNEVRRFEGAIEAMNVTRDAVHLAVMDAGIYRAKADGTDWRLVYSSPARNRP